MPLPISYDIERTAGDRYAIDDFQLVGLATIEGLTSQLRVATTAGVLVGVIDGEIVSATAGTLSFPVDDVDAIRDLEAGTYTYSLILDPDGGQRRTYATGSYVLEAQPVPTAEDEVPAGAASGLGYHGDVYVTRYLPSADVIHVYVSSTSGSDSNAGTSVAPVATTEKALSLIPALLWGRRAIVHYEAGHTETIVRQLYFPPILGGGQVDDVGLDGEEPSWDYLRQQVTLQAAPGTIENVTGTITVLDATTGLIKVTDATKSWTPSEHVGRSIINPGAVAEVGVIWDNTATELYVCSRSFSDGNLRIVSRQATLTLGDGAAFVRTGLSMSANLASVGLVGLNLLTPGAPAIDIMSHGKVAMLMCEISGGFQARGGVGEIAIDACYIHGGSFAPNAGSIAVRTSYLSGLTASFHAVNGQYDLYSCRVRTCGSMGHGGTTTPHGGFRIDNCWISGGTSYGVLNYGGARSRIVSSRIDDCASHAVHFEGSGTMLASTVVGTGSVGYGVNLDNGAIVVPGGTNTLAGTLGEVRLGGSGGATHAWTDAPQTNTTRLCRFGT
jgi:hypothetical protein